MLELVDGSAEVFGTELSLHKRYTFPPGCLFVLSFSNSAV